MTVVLFVVLVFHGQPPITHSEQMPDRQTCLEEAARLLEKTEPPDNGSFQAGCVLIGGKASGT